MEPVVEALLPLAVADSDTVTSVTSLLVIVSEVAAAAIVEAPLWPLVLEAFFLLGLPVIPVLLVVMLGTSEAFSSFLPAPVVVVAAAAAATDCAPINPAAAAAMLLAAMPGRRRDAV